MPAIREDLVIEKGAKFSRAFQYLDLDEDGTTETVIPLTGYIAELAIRSPDVNGELVVRYRSDESGSPLEIDEDDGIIEFAWSAVLNRVDAPDDGCRGWYTLRAWPAADEDEAIRFAEGYVTWSPESTRPDET